MDEVDTSANCNCVDLMYEAPLLTIGQGDHKTHPNHKQRCHVNGISVTKTLFSNNREVLAKFSKFYNVPVKLIAGIFYMQCLHIWAVLNAPCVIDVTVIISVKLW